MKLEIRKTQTMQEGFYIETNIKRHRGIEYIFEGPFETLEGAEREAERLLQYQRVVSDIIIVDLRRI